MRASLLRFATMAALGACILAALSFFIEPRPAVSSTSIALSGYAWSDTIGWISMSGTNYGLSMDSTGFITGYAWSDNIGWISANKTDLSPCAFAATSKIQSGQWAGWLRAISGGSTQSGGWDGCISMSGTNYGVTYNSQTGSFGGYAWGDTNVGWVDFSQVSTGGACQQLQGDNYCSGASIYQHDTQGNACFVSTCAYQCSSGECVAPPHAQGNFSDGSALHLVPSVVSQGQTVNVSWNLADVQGQCTISGGNGDVWHSNADGSGNASGSVTSSAITQQVVYTLSCTGLDNQPYSESHSVNIVPKFEER
jgi:hypothetical protein